jgi:hypothetical protein
MNNTNGLHVTVDTDSISMAEAIRAGAPLVPCAVLTGRALSQLARELGSMYAATRWLLMPAPDGSSQTAFIAPQEWTQERLKGWVAAHHAVLEAQFGEVAGLRDLGQAVD